MHIGIDASNIRAGGGLTHLSEMLSAAQPNKFGIDKITVWACQNTLNKLPDRSWLNPAHDPALEANGLRRMVWMWREFDQLAAHCDLLYIPGGTYLGRFHPYVGQLQNMLPFEFRERLRYGLRSRQFWRLMLLSLLQRQTFARADGVIYVSEYGRKVVMETTKGVTCPSVVVPHGIDERFFKAPRHQEALSEYSLERPYRLLYVSIVNVYKHQWEVAEAVGRLRQSGLPVSIDFVGRAVPNSMKRLEAVMDRYDPERKYMRYRPRVPFEELHQVYHEADAFVFASTCESISNIVIEAMASGLPIACADRSAMPEVLDDAGVYFDPEDLGSITDTIRSLILDPQQRKAYAERAFERAHTFSWQRCADETMAFLAQVSQHHKISSNQ